jgi:hypothetical protein
VQPRVARSHGSHLSPCRRVRAAMALLSIQYAMSSQHDLQNDLLLGRDPDHARSSGVQ